MILIADSGSTKPDWCVVEKGKLIQQISTKGTNPSFSRKRRSVMKLRQRCCPS